MKMEPLDGGRLRVWLSAADMQRFGLAFENLGADDGATRRAIRRLSAIARLRHLLYDDRVLTVEALPTGDGCLLLITPQPHALPQPTVYAVRGADRLLQLRGKLQLLRHRTFPAAALFAWGTEYRLVVYPTVQDCRACRRLLDEFAEPIAAGTVAVAHTEEYGIPLLRDNALERLL